MSREALQPSPPLVATLMPSASGTLVILLSLRPLTHSFVLFRVLISCRICALCCVTVPSMLRDVSLAEFDGSTRLFGRDYKTPLVIAPIGVQAQLRPEEADCATATAAAELEIPFTLSSATSRPLEKVYEHAGFRTNPTEDDDSGVDAWFQLYWPQDDELTGSLLSRAKKAGYRVLVVTLDTWNLGWRPRDLDTAYNPFLTGEGVANVFSDPVFIKKYCEGRVSDQIYVPLPSLSHLEADTPLS